MKRTLSPQQKLFLKDARDACHELHYEVLGWDPDLVVSAKSTLDDKILLQKLATFGLRPLKPATMDDQTIMHLSFFSQIDAPSIISETKIFYRPVAEKIISGILAFVFLILGPSAFYQQWQKPYQDMSSNPTLFLPYILIIGCFLFIEFTFYRAIIWKMSFEKDGFSLRSYRGVRFIRFSELQSVQVLDKRKNGACLALTFHSMPLLNTEIMLYSFCCTLRDEIERRHPTLKNKPSHE